MVTKDELEKVKGWCEKVKAEKKAVAAVERNPFREEIPWMYRFPLIEIDRPKEAAGKSSIVYDSTTRTLWQYYNGEWRKVEPDVRELMGR